MENTQSACREPASCLGYNSCSTSGSALPKLPWKFGPETTAVGQANCAIVGATSQLDSQVSLQPRCFIVNTPLVEMSDDLINRCVCFDIIGLTFCHQHIQDLPDLVWQCEVANEFWFLFPCERKEIIHRFRNSFRRASAATAPASATHISHISLPRASANKFS